MSFLRQCWYFMAWSDELAKEGRIARSVLGDPLFLWRAQDGSVSALLDRCPHRSAPLSAGDTDGKSVRCLYHGLRFDASGHCVENPHGPIVSALNVRAYPIVERHRALWVWMGDPAKADSCSIPDLSFVDRASEHSWSKGYMFTAAGHALLEDNILDLSHADYLHPNTLGGGSMTRSKPRVEARGDTVFVEWIVSNERAFPMFAAEMPDPNAPVDAWTSVLWHPNGLMILEAGATPAGTPREAGINSWNAHIMTPETEWTTHYFYCNCRNFKTDNSAFNEAVAKALRAAFETEDKPMIEAQQRRIGPHDLFDMKPALLSIDAASALARRTFSRLIKAEQHVQSP